MQTPKKKIVVIGGGTGTYTLLSGLKAYTDTVDITAIVTMADSGGSTGRLRDEFGCLPMGDVRMALCALAADVDAHTDIVRELFLYRFSKGEGLSGHNFGNLLLTALTDIVGDTSAAILTASKILRVEGTVIPVTTDNVHLKATYSSGRVVVGEHEIDVPPAEYATDRIVKLEVTPVAVANPAALKAIEAADLIVLGPGDIYTSILANCVVGGVADAIQSSSAKLLYVCNLMSRLGQTIGMRSCDYVDAIEKYVGRRPDQMIVNTAVFESLLLDKYTAEGNHAVEYVRGDDSCEALLHDVVSTESFVTPAGDTIERSLIRHDAKKLAAIVVGR